MASLSAARYAAMPNKFSESLTAVPAVSTDLATKDAMIWQIHVANPTDKQATPRNVIPAVSIAANTAYVCSWPEGLFCSSGVAWTASGAGLEASIVGGYRS
jgi:hypothetical protein